MTAVLIVTGAPASGKTTLGRRLARDLGLPFFNKDDIKEILFETIGWKDREWSRQLGRACYALLYHALEEEIRVGRSVTVESNFDSASATPQFLRLQSRYEFQPVQVFCRADASVVLERYGRREVSGDRHPGHSGALHDLEMHLGSGGTRPLGLAGSLIEVDTTDWSTVDYERILCRVRDAVGPG